MGRVLPLLALRAFTETARHRSLKRAAEAMGVTAGAVSQQLRLLEQRTGKSLFSRTRYGVELTDDGACAYPALQLAFDQIELSLNQLESKSKSRSVTISTVPSFAASWLVPRLGKFKDKNPDIELRIEANPNLVDLRRGPVDIAIRHGLGNYPGCNSAHLITPKMVAVASAELLASGPKIRTIEDCLAHPLLQDADRADWQLWFQALGVAPDERMLRGPSFDDDYLLIRAAISGQGIALIRDIYAAEEVNAGRLVVAIDQPWPTEFAYYIVTAEHRTQRPEMRKFIEWIVTEAASCPH
ncbi:LysR substrate-binding domain-containing protein [Brucella sp. NBRC 12950]|uniref:LysR substrate-binding domain-containing protein n=1 Tax=Brucella sp. NBRC 12950 TaxID=2994518 RepID=UPI0024A4D914|nr:LysR substrate-binding domain-containing protein [Brucella sp. NBRC 12950]GLU27489.1 transcriptional regulator [Brucella sp. NBRC 12950]